MKEKKKEKKIFGIALDLCAVLVLLVVLAGTFRHMKREYFPEETDDIDSIYVNNMEQVGQGDGTDSSTANKSLAQNASKPIRAGTWCTLKSNSLDGVPIYPEAGETFQSGLLPEGKCCELIRTEEADGKVWAEVSYCGQSGWLKLDQLHYISENTYYIRPGDTVYVNALTEKGIKAYKTPSSSSEIAEEGIVYGREFIVQELQDGWGKVQTDSGEFWLNMYHMGSYPVKSWRVETLSSAAEINLREKPDEEAKSLCKVPENTVVTVERFKNGWGKIQYEGQEGWVMLHYLTPAEENH